MVPPLIRKLKLFVILVVSCQLSVISPSAALRADGERPSTLLGTSPEFIEGRSRTTSCYAQPYGYIRVKISDDNPTLRIRINGFYEAREYDSNRVLCRGKNLKSTVTTYQNGILIGRMNFNSNSVLIKAEDTDAITINDRRFRGDIRFIKKDNLNLEAINYIGLEDYVKGILYHEASHYWPKEALKAQALACRTYAVYQIQQNRAKNYDVTSDVYSQVYGGKTSERYRTSEVVESTKGEILVYQGKAFPTYYHATCGGYTQDASLLWNINIMPLKGVACVFCKDSPHFQWHYVLSLEEIKGKLKNSGYKLSDIKDIAVPEKDKTGRISYLKIISEQKEDIISAKDFRHIIGPDLIRSTNFQVSVINHDAVFQGLGWGHGVGLCQWGAYFMAKQGYGYKDILKYYYPGSELGTVLK